MDDHDFLLKSLGESLEKSPHLNNPLLLGLRNGSRVEATNGPTHRILQSLEKSTVGVHSTAADRVQGRQDLQGIKGPATG